MRKNGIASAFFQRISGTVEVSFCASVVDRPRTLRGDCQRSGGRLRSGSVCSIGHSRPGTSLSGGLAGYVGSQCGNRCDQVAATANSSRTSCGCRQSAMVRTHRCWKFGQQHESGSGYHRRTTTGFATARRCDSRYCGLTSLERNDVPPDRRSLRTVARDRSSEIRSRDCSASKNHGNTGCCRC